MNISKFLYKHLLSNDYLDNQKQPCFFLYDVFGSDNPCIRLARGKFELTNQDSAGGKKSSVLTKSKKVRKDFEIRQLFSLEMALNIHEKELHFQNPYQFAKSEKYEPFCVSKLLFWRQKMGRSKFVEYRKVGK